MPRMMIVISDESLHQLAVLAHRRVEATGEDLARAYRREAARLLEEKIEEVAHGTEVDSGAGATGSEAVGTDATPTGGA